MKLPNGLKLFIADIIDEDSGDNYIWYVVGRAYDSAFKRFTKEANKTWRTYLYYFDEASKDSEASGIFKRSSAVSANSLGSEEIKLFFFNSSMIANWVSLASTERFIFAVSKFVIR